MLTPEKKAAAERAREKNKGKTPPRPPVKGRALPPSRNFPGVSSLPTRSSKKNKKGESVIKTKTSTGRKKLVLKDSKSVSTTKKGKKVLEKKVTHRNPDNSHKKTVTKTADGSKSVSRYKKGKTFMDNKRITRTTNKAGEKSKETYNFGKRNKKGETTVTTKNKDSKGGVTTKREIYKKNKKGKAIVKTKTKGPDGKKTTSKRDQVFFKQPSTPVINRPPTRDPDPKTSPKKQRIIEKRMSEVTTGTKFVGQERTPKGTPREGGDGRGPGHMTVAQKKKSVQGRAEAKSKQPRIDKYTGKPKTLNSFDV